MARHREIGLLLDDVMSGRVSRRAALQRAAALGLSVPALAALVGRADRTLARQEGSPAASPGASPVASAGPPIAEKVPSTRTFGGREIVDPYAWLEDPTDPTVIAYLEAENAYADLMLAPTAALQDELYEEFVTRIPQTDSSVPIRIDDYYYYGRIEEGQDYLILARRQGSMTAPEQVLLNLNEMAGEFLSLGVWEPSPDHRYLAYTLNLDGGIDYSLYILDTATGDLLPDAVSLADSVAWGNNNSTIFYTVLDEALRPFKLYRHNLGDDLSSDALLFTEIDEEFAVYLFKTNDKKYIFCTSYSYVETEVHVLNADRPDQDPTVLVPRREGISVYPDHGADGFLFMTNEGAVNFRLMAAPVATPGRANWIELIPGQDSRLLVGLDVLETYLGIYGRENGFTQVWTFHVASRVLAPVAFDEAVFTAYSGTNRNYDATTLQLTYSSLVTPFSVYELDVVTGQRTLLKQNEILGDHDPANYTSQQLFATAPDGTQVPISLVYRNDAKSAGPTPLRLDGYGAYGISYDPEFSALRLSLIDRGVVYAIAHIRGGTELGQPWYSDGKLLRKKNTFTDYIACADHLIAEGWTANDRLVAYGGSAGGLLLGAVANMAPDRFGAIVAEVPFVDLMRVMLDPTLPLTTGEYVEWGNPEEDEYYDYMLSYSPYDNVAAQDYPNLMFTGGLNDDQVQYWQPAKLTAKLRDTKTDDNMLILKTNLDAGHAGESGRDDSYREVAYVYAFMLMHMGLAG